MEIIDSRVNLNCPFCGDPMQYKSTAPNAQFYLCLKHGSVALRANWQFLQTADDQLLRRRDARPR
jgi:hypothetical protein